MEQRDLTPAAATHADPYGPAEARAEIEAFMGEGWEPFVYGPCPVDSQALARAWRGSTSVAGCGPTYRAAVDALKAAWRDAVRPWCVSADNNAFSAGMQAQRYVCGTYGVELSELEQDEDRVARVLKEDSK